MKRKLAVDIDGVMTRNVYLAPEKRTPENYAKLPPNEDVIKTLVKLKNNHQFDIMFISARPKDLWETTWCWIREQSKSLSFSTIMLGFKAEGKAAFCERTEWAILIDDSMEAIAACDDTIVKGMLFIDQENRRYPTKGYKLFMSRHEDQRIVDEFTLLNDITTYFKEAGIVF